MRAEYNHIIDILNERRIVLNEFRDDIDALQRASDVQFKRIAQMQTDIDSIKQMLERMKALA
jgi:hypothetical protein